MLIGSMLAAALRFRVLLAALGAALLVVGVITLSAMHTDTVPELSSGPVLEVQTEALGLSSQEVEQYVTVPLENNLLNGVMGVWDVRSHSVPGLSAIDLHFEPGVTVLHARQLVQERLTNAFSLPNVSKPPLLIQPLSTSSRALLIGMSSRTLDPLELSYLARWVVKPRLAGVQGVANVVIWGQRDRQLQVAVDPARMARAHVTLSQVIQTAGNAQLVSPLSYLEGASPGTGGFIDGPNQRLEIRPVLPLGAPKNLAAAPIADAPGRLSLGSVANVQLGSQPLIGDALTGAGDGPGHELVLLVQKLPGASVTGVTTGVQNALRDLRPALTGVTLDEGLYKPATYAHDSLSNVELVALIAAGLVLLAMLAVTFDVPAAAVGLVVAAASLLLATLILDLMGQTMNALVVLGLLISLGVVIDDGLATTEAMLAAIRRRDRELGPSPAMLVIEALGPLRGTLGYATLIALLCAVPAFVSHGLAATFVHPMLLAFALAVIASTVLALVLTPGLGLLVLSRRRLDGPARGPIAAAGRAYRRVLAATLRIPRAALLAVPMIGLIGVVALPLVSEPAAPSFADRNLVVSFNGPLGASLPEVTRVASRTLSALRSIPGVSSVGATIGRAVGGDQIVDPNAAQLYVAVAPSADLSQVRSEVRATAASVPGFSAAVSNAQSAGLSGVLAPAKQSVTVRVYGEDQGTLGQLARQFAGQMRSVHNLGTPLIQSQAVEPNIEVRVNDAAAVRAGVLPGDARRQASTLVQGLTVGNFFQDQAVFDVVVFGEAAIHRTVSDIARLPIDTSGGGHVRLGQIATVGIQANPFDLQHEALSRYVDVTAPLLSGDLGDARAAVGRLLPNVAMPLAFHAEVVGDTPEDATSHAAFVSYLLAAAIGVLLLLQAALGGWRLAAMVFLALPVTIAGGLLLAVITGHFNSLATDAGLLGALAFSVRQGLPLLASIRRAQLRGGGTLDSSAVLDASAERFASAFGAACVLAVALIPFIVLGNAPGNELGHVAATVMLGALLTSIPVNLLILPALCAAFPGAPAPSIDEALQELNAEQAMTVSGGGGTP